MREDTRIEGPVVFLRGQEYTNHIVATAKSWRVIALGVVTTFIVFAALGALAWLLTTSGIVPNSISTNGGRRLAVIPFLGLVILFAFGTGFAVGMSRARSSVLVGPAVATIVLVTSIAVAFPFVDRIADFKSVAVALEIIDAPDVGTRVSNTLDRLLMAVSEAGDTAERDVLSSAWDHVRATLWYLADLAVALVLAAILRVVLGRRTKGAPGFEKLAQVWAGLGLSCIASGMAVLTISLWPHIWAAQNALLDFDQSAGPGIGVSLSEVARHPDVMWGQTVTISAREDQALNPHAMILGNDNPVVGDKILVVGASELDNLVLLPQESDFTLDEGDVLQVTGTVRRYDLGELEARLGINLELEALSDYESRAVLVAEAIDADVPIASEEGDKEFSGGSSGYDLGVTIDDIVAEPEEYAGLTVTAGYEVEEHLLMPHSFLLGDEALLAISNAPRRELFVEATVYVTGEVQLFNLRRSSASWASIWTTRHYGATKDSR